MALLQLSKKAGDNPTTSLQDALEGFRDVLTEEQKRQYQASSTTPDVASVIEFVARIDASSSTRRRCVAPRLCSFLESIQQFSGVVDTFINSNPEISALVWGSAKTAILAATNVASYFEKLTTIIMSVGKMCPTYQEFGQLYPGSVGLQRALSEFYAVIIHLCIKIIEVSRRNAIKQTFSSVLMPFESEFKIFIDKLEQATKGIYLQILLASEKADHETRKLLQYETQESAKFRPLALNAFKRTTKQQDEANQWRVDQQARQTAKLKSSIRSNLSSINHVANWRQAILPRVSTTADWLQQDPAFVDWKESPGSAAIWCSGTMGMGKTVLISSSIAHLHANREISDVIAYHFCRGDNEASLSSKGILSSLARQIIDRQIENSAYEDLLNLHDATRDLKPMEIGASEVTQFIISRLEADKKYYIIVDGLDECKTGEAQMVVQCIDRICRKYRHNLKVLYSSWPELGNAVFGSVEPHFRVLVNEENVNSDMRHYITATLDRCLAEGRLRLSNPTIILEVTRALLNGSGGMFLWTRLLIEELCILSTDEKILEALKHLPRGLSEIFDRKLSRVREGPGGSEAISLLQFCGGAKRPLSTAELQEALSLSPCQRALDPKKYPNDMERVIRNCCGLTFIDEEEDTVHYIHHSVKQHLFTHQHHGPEPWRFSMHKVELHIGSLCMTYLNFADFKSQLVKAKGEKGSLINAFQLGTLPVYHSSKTANQMAQKLLLRYRENQFQHLGAQEIVRMAHQTLGDNDYTGVKSQFHAHDFHFLQYAKRYWINHLADLDENASSNDWRLFCRLIEQNDTPALKPWESDHLSQNDRKKIPRTLAWSIAQGHYSMLLYHARHLPHALTESVKREIIRAAAIHDDSRLIEVVFGIEGSLPLAATLNEGLIWAAAEGRIRPLMTLLKAGAISSAEVNGQTPLQAAVEGSHLNVVNFLLAENANVNEGPGEKGRTALQASAAGGHNDIFETLLAANAEINAPPAATNGRTALQAAAEGGYIDLVRVLLALKADVNAPPASYGGRTALQAAVQGGHRDIIEALLAAGADVNAPALEAGRTAAQAAAGAGFLDLLQELMAIGANVNAPASRSGRTALQAAAENGHLRIVQALITANAHVNAPSASHRGRTAIQAAAEYGHLDIIRLLLAARADVNAPPSSHGGRTALQAASAGGYLDIVEELLAAKADATASPAINNGRTALQAAAEGGSIEIVRAILQAGAKIDELPALENGRTALQAAAEQGHMMIVTELLTILGYDLTRVGHSNGRLRKANITTALPVIDAPASSRNGRTALQAAAQGGHIEIVRILIAVNSLSDASPAPYGGRTALQAAAESGHLRIVEMLLAAGNDVNGPPAPYGGRTALQAAAERGHIHVAKALLAAQADVGAPASASDGLTALDAAAQGGLC